MNSDLEQRLREALDNDAAGARLVNPDRPADPDARAVPGTRHPASSRRRLVVAAAAIALIAAAGAVWFENARDRDTKVTTSPDPADSTTATTEAGFTTANLNDAVENGEVPAELRLDNVVVTVQCAHTRMSIRADLTRREVMLGGVVTANPDGIAMLDGVNVAVGDQLALVVRGWTGAG